jgi:hypothetical protein
MNRQPVKSSYIRSIGYDPKNQTLELEFNDGDVYQYENFPKAKHEALLSAKSIGQFFHKNIRAQHKASQ